MMKTVLCHSVRKWQVLAKLVIFDNIRKVPMTNKCAKPSLQSLEIYNIVISVGKSSHNYKWSSQTYISEYKT